MKFLLLLIQLTFLFNTGFNNKQKSNIYSQKEIKLKWLLTGLPDDNTAKNIIAKMYGFEYLNVGGCVVSKKLKDSITIVNKATNSILIKKFGKKSRWEFEERVEYIEQKMRLYNY